MKNIILSVCALLAHVCVFASTPVDAPLVRPISTPYSITQGLQGRHIALWGSHGMYYNAEEDRWKWQRAHVWTTVEDLFTSSFTAPYLVPMLENAGAIVMQPRAYVRPGYQTIYVRWNGTWRQPIQTVHVKMGTDVAMYQVNTSIGVGLWHYLCTVPKGACEVTGLESMIVDENTMGVSGWPRYMEAARYWLPDAGVPNRVWFKDSTYTDYLNDIACRGQWVNYLCGQSPVNPEKEGLGIPVDLSLAVHSDAGATMNEGLVGTMLIYTNHDNSGSRSFPTGQPRSITADLADSIMFQIEHDIRGSLCPRWKTRGVKKANYGETRVPVVPALIIELLSHQNYADMKLALNPQFRQAMARAIYKGIGRYFAAQTESHFVPQPLAPVAMRTSLSHDTITLSWQPQTDSLEEEAKPIYYIVYKRINNDTWDFGTRVRKRSYQLKAQVDTQYDFCVVAVNSGGLSLRSTVVSACKSSDTLPPMLIVDAFNEVAGPKMMAFDSLTGGVIPGSRPIPDGYEMAYVGHQINYNRRDPWHTDDECGFGMCRLNMQGQMLVGNTHDYAAIHGKVLTSIQRSYVSCTMDALTAADSAYTDVDVVLGKSSEETVRKMNEWISNLHWTDDSSHVLVSGAYLGHPHQACASGCIRLDARSYSFQQELNTTQLSAEDVTALSKNDPTDVIRARYADTSLPAIISNKNYVIAGFPLETLDNFDTVYKILLKR